MAAADTPLGRLAAQHRADSAGSPLALLAAPNVADALQRFRYLTKAATRRDGDTLAAKERRHGSTGDRNLFYGEFAFESFAILLHKIRDKYRGLSGAGATMVDLGSGLAKLVVAAALLHPFRRCYGVETLEALHDAAVQVVDVAAKEIAQVPPAHGAAPEILLFYGDFLDLGPFDWTSCQLAVAASTFFRQETMEELGRLADRMAPGSFFITTTVPLPSRKWEVLEEDVYSMSWGSATVFLQRRRPLPV